MRDSPGSLSTVDGKALMCGCPYNRYQAAGHREGCWLAAAETIALEAYTDPGHDGDPLAGTFTALVEAGYLRLPDSEGELLSLLDALTEAELLGPAPAERPWGP